jgi:hypothetical protein
MKITITNESGDSKEMLHTKDKVTYEVKNQEIIDFFIQLNEAYSNGDDMDELFECLYNLLNFGYLLTDSEYENFKFEEEDYDIYDEFDDDDFDDDFDYDENLDYDEDEDEDFSDYGFKMIKSKIEYYVDGEEVTKEDYDAAWDERLGYMGSSNWEEGSLLITNTETDEIIFLGKIS